MQRRHLLTALASATTASWVHAAPSDPGISDREILIGQSAVLSGPLGGSMKGFNAGAGLAFDALNKQGGLNGRSLRLVSIDDELKPDRAQANYRKLAEEDKVFAFFGGVGSGTIAAVAPYLRETGIPLVGNFAVSDTTRQLAKGAAYFLRAPYNREADRIVQHLTTLGINRLAVAHLDNPGGAEVLALVTASLKARAPGNEVLAAAAVKNDGSNLEPAIAKLAAAKPQAVIMFLSGPPVSKLMAGLWAAGLSPLFYGMSVVAGEQVAADLGGKLRGLAISQTMPFPWSQSDPVAQAYQKQCEAAQVAVGYYSFEGYLNALLLIEALKRSGKSPSRSALHATMRTLNMRLSTIDIDFSESDGLTGSRFVELVQVAANGRFLR